jgi:hypothetical protein
MAAILEPVLWETHSRPQLGDRPQALINKQLVESCDILVGASWTRLGTQTGQAESGTAEEIEEFRMAGKPVLLYFSSAPVVLDNVDKDQYERLREYRDKMKAAGLISSYDEIAGFRELLLRHLNGTLSDMHTGGPPPAPKPVDVPVAESDQAKALRIFKENFSAFVRRLQAEWSSERDSGPYSTDEGRSIMRGARAELLNFRSQITKDGSGKLTAALDEAMKRVRELERHDLVMDGGISFRKFLDLGDSVLESLKVADTLLESDSS